MVVVQDADDTIPEPPGAGVSQGVLPRLIATLVQRRRQVKSLMKDRTITHAKCLQVCDTCILLQGVDVDFCCITVRYQTAGLEADSEWYVRVSWFRIP